MADKNYGTFGYTKLTQNEGNRDTIDIYGDSKKWTQSQINTRIELNNNVIDVSKEAARGLDPKIGRGKEFWDGIKHREDENKKLQSYRR